MKRSARVPTTASIALGLVLVVACGRGARRADATPLPCELGPAFQPAVLAVPGYPLARPKLGPDELARRKAELEARVPGWTIVLHPSGALATATSEPVGDLQDSIDAARVAKALAFVRTLADELELVGTVDAHADGRGVAFSIGGKPVGLYAQQTTPGPHLPYRLLLTHDDPPPKLPAGARERTPEEIVAALGPSWPMAKVRVSTMVEGQPCDPVHGPEDCSGAGGGVAASCRFAAELGFVAGVVQTPTGFRRVVALRGCQGASTQCDASFPTCIDAVTGEAVTECFGVR